MSYVKWKVVHYPILTTGYPITWSGTGTEITDIYDPIISVAIGDKKDSFSLKLNNPYGRWDNYFKPNDKLEIYRVTNTSTFTSDDIVMVGVIRNVPKDSTGTRDEIRLEGHNLGEAVTTGIVFYDTSDVAKTPLEIIKGALESLQLQNSNFTVTWDSSNPLLTKKDGSAFPTYKKRYFYKPLSKVIEEQLSDSYTDDGAYLWWVDKDNNLVIRPNTYGASYTYNPSTDFTTVAYKDARDISQVRNFIILKGGLDPSNKPIQTVLRDYTSISKNGMKFYFAVSNTVSAQNLNQQDVGTQAASNKYPTSYPFTTTWYASYTETVSGVSVVSNTRTTVNSDTQYREVLRKEIVTRLTKEAQAIIDVTAAGKLQVDLSMTAGSKAWALGDRVSCTIASLGITNKELRVKEIQKTTDMDTFSLEEDIGTI